jgi:ribosomal protein S6
MLFVGEREADGVGALNFKGKVTEERAVELFIQSNKGEIPNLESWGMRKK